MVQTIFSSLLRSRLTAIHRADALPRTRTEGQSSHGLLISQLFIAFYCGCRLSYRHACDVGGKSDSCWVLSQGIPAQVWPSSQSSRLPLKVSVQAKCDSRVCGPVPRDTLQTIKIERRLCNRRQFDRRFHTLFRQPFGMELLVCRSRVPAHWNAKKRRSFFHECYFQHEVLFTPYPSGSDVYIPPPKGRLPHQSPLWLFRTPIIALSLFLSCSSLPKFQKVGTGGGEPRQGTSTPRSEEETVHLKSHRSFGASTKPLRLSADETFDLPGYVAVIREVRERKQQTIRRFFCCSD